MQQIIVKIMGQDNLSSMLVKIAKSMDNVGKSGKKVSTSFTSSINQMEKNASKTATQINQSLNKANKIRFKALSGGFKTTVKQMETQAQGASKTVNSAMETINKTKFQTLGTELIGTTKEMETQAQGASKTVNSALGTINQTKFKPLSIDFQTATETMESASKVAGTGIARDFDQVNKTKFQTVGHNFDNTMKGMEKSAQTATRGIINHFSGMGTAIAGLGIGMGVHELFGMSKERATSGAALKNIFGSQSQGFLDEYTKFTQISSTPDEQLNRIFRGLIQMPKVQAKHVGGLLNAADALSSTGDSYDENKFRYALMDFLSTGDALKLKDDLGKKDMGYLETKWDLAKKTGDPTIVQKAMEEMAKKRGRMDSEGHSLSTTTDGELGAYNKTLAAFDLIVQNARDTFNMFMQSVVSPAIDIFNHLNDATGGFLAKLTGGGIIVVGMATFVGMLAAGLFKVKDILGGVKERMGNVFGKKHKLDMDCGVCPPGSLLGGQGGANPVPGGGGKIPTIEKSTKNKGGKVGGVGRSLGAITRLSGRAGTALRGVASAVGLLAVAETAAAVAGSAMFLPIIAGAAAAGIAIYALTAGTRRNADTMRGYNDALKNGEKRINELKEASESYKKKVTELTAEKNKLKATGKDVGYIEKEIQDARNKSAQAARDAARAEEALKKAREEHERITTESTTDDTDYTTNIGQKLRETGRYGAEELQTLDKQNASLRDGTALRQHGLNEKKRVHSEGAKFITNITEGKNAESEAWLKDKKAIDEYATGMDSLAKLEEKYMKSDSWTEKIGIWFEQGITKMQVGWVKSCGIVLKVH